MGQAGESLKKSKKLTWIISAIIFACVCLAAYMSVPPEATLQENVKSITDPEEKAEAIEKMQAWYSVIPPLVAILLAFVTQRMFLSLGLAVASGILLASPTSTVSSFGKIYNKLHESIFDWWNFKIIAFVMLILAMISVMVSAGGLQGIVNWLSRFAKSRRSSRVITVLMGLAIFIDDYANTMIIGTSMRPLTDKFKVSREKLAFLTDATAAPIAGIAFVSTWVGFEAEQFDKAAKILEISKDGYEIFFDVIAFRFYCLLMIVFSMVNAFLGRDYGPMLEAEKRAAEKGEVAAADAKELTSATFAAAVPDENAKHNALSAILPMMGLIGFLFAGLWFSGASQVDVTWANAFQWDTVGKVLKEADNVKILAWSALVGLGIAAVCAFFFSRMPIKKIIRATLAGLRSSLFPAFILLIAFCIRTVCLELGTGNFLGAAIGTAIPKFFFPAIMFLLASVVAFAIGTSWTTMMILIPIMAGMAHSIGWEYDLTVMMSLAAILDGAILGDHCSPVSDTTILSSIASSCDHIHHVRTQLPYGLTVGAIAISCGYLLTAALGAGYSWVGLLIGSALIVAVHFIFGRKVNGH